MFEVLADANTSAGAPSRICSRSVELLPRLSTTSVPGLASSKAASTAAKASVREAAAETNISPSASPEPPHAVTTSTTSIHIHATLHPALDLRPRGTHIESTQPSRLRSAGSYLRERSSRYSPAARATWWRHSSTWSIGPRPSSATMVGASASRWATISPSGDRFERSSSASLSWNSIRRSLTWPTGSPNHRRSRRRPARRHPVDDASGTRITRFGTGRLGQTLCDQSVERAVGLGRTHCEDPPQAPIGPEFLGDGEAVGGVLGEHP